ncbi:VCBS repeat-containing protein [Lacinutrix sp. C3R15]|uniref:FG-GAP repeat domain-containing protein n=1 Tax=Flavobacteriaceae TaxID=49546 RepID=UPI001C0808BF|nr:MULTISPECIES: VCBS repeat-containing protein [Flavobacteriaceae]MBU2938938.1 VCBS repeat-containing protein [Lacinutrix sp. C3R15]MDO6622251.1 VCBS repeat-containing protein [Oceanihabitans sp. 1_MG-2023]
MKNLKLIFVVSLVVMFFSCSDNDTTQSLEETLSGNNALLHLILEYEDTDYDTSISNATVSNNTEFPFLAQQVTVKYFEISQNATTNISVEQTFNIANSPFNILVTAANGTSRNYSLILTKDEGLAISPNENIENGSSYTIQSSNVYVDAAQLTQDFDRFHFTAYADFNNDGNTDVLIASGLFQTFEYSPITLFLGDGNGVNANYCECGGSCSNYSCSSFTEMPNILPSGYEGLQHPRKILTGDYNGDNLIDAFIIATGYDAYPFPGESPVLLLNNGNGFNYEKLTNISGFYHGGSSADFDNDGDIDIFIVGVPSTEESLFLINDGFGNFTTTTQYIDSEFHQDTRYYTSEFIDINSDGYIDLLLAGHEHEGADTLILLGNSSGKYYKDLSSTIPEVSGFNIVVDIDAIDIDNDGDRDLILNRVDSNNFYQNYYLQVVENEGNTNFSDITNTSISNNTGANWYPWLHVQDLNNDGNADVYLESDHVNNLKWIGDGNGILY